MWSPCIYKLFVICKACIDSRISNVSRSFLLQYTWHIIMTLNLLVYILTETQTPWSSSLDTKKVYSQQYDYVSLCRRNVDLREINTREWHLVQLPFALVCVSLFELGNHVYNTLIQQMGSPCIHRMFGIGKANIQSKVTTMSGSFLYQNT